MRAQSRYVGCPFSSPCFEVLTPRVLPLVGGILCPHAGLATQEKARGLKAITDCLDSVEEQFRPIYEETDGKLVLQIEGIEAPRRAIAQGGTRSRPHREAYAEREVDDRRKPGWKVCPTISTPTPMKRCRRLRKARNRRRSMSDLSARRRTSRRSIRLKKTSSRVGSPSLTARSARRWSMTVSRRR